VNKNGNPYLNSTNFFQLENNYYLQLRNHLKNIVEKTHTMQNAVSLSNPDTLSMHLETRLHQLDFAIQMELWQVGLVLHVMILPCPFAILAILVVLSVYTISVCRRHSRQ